MFRTSQHLLFTDAIAWADREGLNGCFLIILIPDIAQPALWDEHIGVDEVGGRAVGGPLADAYRSL